MSPNEHTPHRENIPAYAIGVLDAEDTAALETHLGTCASCRDELAEYRLVSQSLLTAVPPGQPSAALRKRLQNRLPSAQKSRRPQWTFSLNRLGLGFALITLLVLNLLSFLQLRQIQNRQSALSDQVANAQSALAMLSSPDVQILPFSAEKASGTILVNKAQNRAVLITQNMPELVQSQTYQIWLIQPDGKRISAGLFRPESGGVYTKSIASSQLLSNFVGIGVTVEPAGGSESPTGERIFKVDF